MLLKAFYNAHPQLRKTEPVIPSSQRLSCPVKVRFPSFWSPSPNLIEVGKPHFRQKPQWGRQQVRWGVVLEATHVLAGKYRAYNQLQVRIRGGGNEQSFIGWLGYHHPVRVFRQGRKQEASHLCERYQPQRSCSAAESGCWRVSLSC